MAFTEFESLSAKECKENLKRYIQALYIIYIYIFYILKYICVYIHLYTHTQLNCLTRVPHNRKEIRGSSGGFLPLCLQFVLIN